MKEYAALIRKNLLFLRKKFFHRDASNILPVCWNICKRIALFCVFIVVGISPLNKRKMTKLNTTKTEMVFRCLFVLFMHILVERQNEL